MQPQNVPREHPDPKQLFEFATGRLADDQATAVESHLADCETCADALGHMTLSDDSFVAAIMEVGQDADLTSSADSPTSVGQFTTEGRFRILRKHAQGGLGEVIVAYDDELDREVALKRIRADRAGDRSCRERFLVEAEITGKLEHPAIVPLYGLDKDAAGQPFYTMRFIRGESLQEGVRKFHNEPTPSERQGSHARILGPRRLLRHFVDICNAVAYAHSRGVLHRDLKPSNVMLGQFGETLLVDWGLAKVLKTDDDESQHDAPAIEPKSRDATTATRLGSLMGTLEYASPEQVKGQHDKLTPASDIYSLGATLYEILTGKAPFHRDDQARDGTQNLVDRITAGEFPSPRAVDRRVPTSLEAICLKAMSREPGARYATARELADDVEAWLADEPVLGYAEPLRVRTARWVRKHTTLVMTLAAVLVVGFPLTLLLSNSYRSERYRRAETHATAAESANQRGDIGAAMDHLDQALQLGHADADRLRLKRLTLLAGSMSDLKPLTTMAEALAKTQYRAEALMLHGDLLLTDPKRIDEGQRLIRQALDLGLAPSDENYARAMLANTSRDALAYLRATVELNPYHRRALGQLALVLILLGEREAARHHISVAGQLSPDSVTPHICSAWLAGIEGRSGKAEWHIERVGHKLNRRDVARLRRICRNLHTLESTLPQWMTTQTEVFETRLGELLNDLFAFDSQLSFRVPPVVFRSYRVLHDAFVAAQQRGRAAPFVDGLAQAGASHPDGFFHLVRGLVLAVQKRFEPAETASLQAANSTAMFRGVQREAWYTAAMSAKALAQQKYQEKQDHTQDISRALEYARRRFSLGPLETTHAEYLANIGKDAASSGFDGANEFQRMVIRQQIERGEGDVLDWLNRLARLELRDGNYVAAVGVAEKILSKDHSDADAKSTREKAMEKLREYLENQTP